jgi:O-antigen ligase
VLNGAFEQPWIGHGFDAMWKIIPPFGPDRFEARHGENELLTQFYAYGIVGVCMLMGLYGSLYRQIRKLPRSPLRMVLLSLLLFILIRGLAEAEPFDLLLPLWVIVLFSLMVEDAALGNRPNAMTATPVAPRLNPARAGSPEIVITL